MYKTLHKKQGSVTVQLRFARSSVTFCAKRDSRLGHSDVTTTLNIYSHALKELDRKASDALVDTLSKKANTKNSVPE